MNVFEILYRFRDALTTAQPIKTAFNSIQQILQYGDLVCDTASNTSLKKFETKQNFRNKTKILKKIRHQSKFLEKNKGFSQKTLKKNQKVCGMKEVHLYEQLKTLITRLSKIWKLNS